MVPYASCTKTKLENFQFIDKCFKHNLKKKVDSRSGGFITILEYNIIYLEDLVLYI